MAQRIYNLLDDVKAESDEKTYILVAHNGMARVVQSAFAIIFEIVQVINNVFYSMLQVEQAVFCADHMLQYNLCIGSGGRQGNRQRRKCGDQTGTFDAGAGRISQQIQKMRKLRI